MQEKKCSKCKETKSIEAFGIIKSDGKRRFWCKECNKKAEQHRREVNPVACRMSSRKWYRKNKDKSYNATLKWQKAHPVSVKAYARKAKIKRCSNPQYLLGKRISCSVFKSLRGNKKGRRWESLVGYGLDELKTHIEKLFKKDMSWERLMNGEIHIDHIIPVSAFNFEKPEDDDFKRCWALSNLQPLWAKDNLKKSNRINKHFQPSIIF